MANIRKHRNKWQARVRRVGAGSLVKSFLRREDAVTWARHMEVRADRRELPADPKALRGVTLGDLVKRYRDTVSIKKRGYEYERVTLTAFLRHPICSKRLTDLQTADFVVYRDERLRTVRASSLKRSLDPLHNLFELARDEWGLPIGENPLDKLKIIVPPNRRERRLSADEWRRLQDALCRTRNPWVEPILRLALATAMRRGEIIAIQGSHLNPEGRTLTIPMTKNGYARTIPLTQDALKVFVAFQHKQGRLFPISPNAFRLAWERLRARAQLSDLHFHDLRHEAISRLFEMGLNAYEVALISGHRDTRMLFRYTHPLTATITEKFAAAFGG